MTKQTITVSRGEPPATEHEIKAWPEYFDRSWDRRKPFELRAYDRPYQIGHTLLLREYEPTTCRYSGRWLRCLITDMVSGGPWLAPGYVALGIRELARGEGDV